MVIFVSSLVEAHKARFQTHAGVCSRFWSTNTVLVHHPRASAATVTAPVNTQRSADISHLETGEKRKACKKWKCVGSESCSAERACWHYIFFFYPCLAFCPLSVLDILWWRSKAQERDVSVCGCQGTMCAGARPYKRMWSVTAFIFVFCQCSGGRVA